MPGMDSYRPLAAAPELHQDWSDAQEERNVTWPELFYDLFFVAAISNLSHLFKKHPDAPNAGRIMLYHAVMFFIWSDYAMLKTRYSLRGLLFRVVGLCLQLGTLGFIIGTRDDVAWYRLLAGGYACARAALTCTYSIIAYTIPRARALAMVHAGAGVVLLSLAVIVTAGSFQGDTYPTFIKVFAVIALGEALVPVIPSFAPKIDLPLHVEHMNERLGQVIMLHLGEAVIGFAASPLESTVPQFIGVALAATLVWSLHLCYYHIEPDQHSHAYRQSRARGLLYFYSHWLLAVALLLTGAGLRLILEMYPGPEADAQEEPLAPLSTSLMLCVAYGASWHILAIIRAAHYFSLTPEHRAVRSVESAGVKHWWLMWWAVLVVAPMPVYLLPLLVKLLNHDAAPDVPDDPDQQSVIFGVSNSVSNGNVGISVSLLLGLLAGHSVVLTCAESFFAHKITQTPVLQGLNAPEGSDTGQDDA